MLTEKLTFKGPFSHKQQEFLHYWLNKEQSKFIYVFFFLIKKHYVMKNYTWPFWNLKKLFFAVRSLTNAENLMKSSFQNNKVVIFRGIVGKLEFRKCLSWAVSLVKPAWNVSVLSENAGSNFPSSFSPSDTR